MHEYIEYGKETIEKNRKKLQNLIEDHPVLTIEQNYQKHKVRFENRKKIGGKNWKDFIISDYILELRDELGDNADVILFTNDRDFKDIARQEKFIPSIFFKDLLKKNSNSRQTHRDKNNN